MGARGPKPGTQAKTPGSGRQKGTPNKRTLEVREILEANGYDPNASVLFWARVLKSAMEPLPKDEKKDTAEQFYLGSMVVSDGKDVGSHVEPIYGRATAQLGMEAADRISSFLWSKRTAVRVELKRPHDMTDDELDAAIREAFRGNAGGTAATRRPAGPAKPATAGKDAKPGRKR